jgi:hypothetical protein
MVAILSPAIVNHILAASGKPCESEVTGIGMGARTQRSPANDFISDLPATITPAMFSLHLSAFPPAVFRGVHVARPC